MYHIDCLRIWTIFVSLGWIPLDHGVLSFYCTVEFSLLISCWRFLHQCSSRIFYCNFLFLWFLVCLWYQHKASLVKWLWKCLRMAINSSMNFWQNSLVMLSGLGLLLLIGSFLIIELITLHVIILFSFLFFHDSVSKFMLLRIRISIFFLVVLLLSDNC